MTGLDIQSSCHRLETIYQPQCDGSGEGRVRYPKRLLLGMKLEERDGGVHHCMEASGINLIMKRATSLYMHHHHHHHHKSIDRRGWSPPPSQTLYTAVANIYRMVMCVHCMPLSVRPAVTLSPSRTQSMVPSLLDSLHRLQCRVTWTIHFRWHRLTKARRCALGPTSLSTLLRAHSLVFCSRWGITASSWII